MREQANPQRMDLTARVAFAKVYPAIASHIVKKYGITTGKCLDAGSGPGSLTIALAKITDLQMISLDIQPEMTELATKNFAEEGLVNRIKAVTADICHIPYEDNYFDLIVSRGSIFFWDDQVGGLRELYRVLKPGGVIYCGGGMGSEEIRHEVTEIIMTDERFGDMRSFWLERSCKPADKNKNALKKAIYDSGLNGKLLSELSGIWIEIIK
jgi:ubiquinone/menaquinone biosynthesis C-methylase UbiE